MQHQNADLKVLWSENYYLLNMYYVPSTVVGASYSTSVTSTFVSFSIWMINPELGACPNKHSIIKLHAQPKVFMHMQI